MERSNSRKLLPFAREMREAPSEAEQKLWQCLRNRQLEGLRFRRQLPIGPFIADFACEACKLIVEVDGLQHDDAVQYDRHRSNELGRMGWRVLRSFAGDVLKDIGGVLQTIVVAARPHPNPLP
ncbi:MAG TPA: DUF559 domain-containing protein [Tepidisphaeraceae bacterium]|jgi:very-short-patch-repair endonuclease